MLLGTINDGDSRAAKRGQSHRIIKAAPRVRVFVDLTKGCAELYCPACGACGRTVRADTVRGVVLW